MNAVRWMILMLLALATLAGCKRGQSLEDLPTVAAIDDMATAQFLTRNAPPEGYREGVAFPQIDQGLELLPGWRYEVQLEFDGTFADAARETSATAQATVWANPYAVARRVMVTTSGELLGQEEDADWEAVRLGPDAFLVRDGVCLSNVGEDAQTAADLNAGTLVGGVTQATPTGQHATLNGEEAWEFGFTLDHLNLPSIRYETDGRIASVSGELWVAPEHDVVVRFYLTMEVENALIFDRELPVSGQVIVRYDLYEIGVTPNISVPFGC